MSEGSAGNYISPAVPVGVVRWPRSWTSDLPGVSMLKEEFLDRLNRRFGDTVCGEVKPRPAWGLG